LARRRDYHAATTSNIDSNGSQTTNLYCPEFSRELQHNKILRQVQGAGQCQPYLDNQKADRGYKIERAAYTVNFPIGIYPKKHKTWDAVPDGGTLTIPNDPTNCGRVLLLLPDKDVLQLTNGVGFKPTVADVVANLKKLKIVEIDAAQTPRTLDDVDAAAVNTNYATQAGLESGQGRDFA
jgi:YaeC family lipoprotein